MRTFFIIIVLIMTLKEHTYFIQNIINSGPKSDDARFSNRLVAHALKSARSKLIYDKLNKYSFVADANYTTVCIPLEKYDLINDCPCAADSINCEAVQSTCKLPKELVSRWGTTLQITTVTNDLVSEISKVSNDLAAYSITNTKPKRGWEIVGGHLRIYNDPKIEYVLGKALWEDPEEVTQFCSCANTPECSSYMTEEFPIDPDLTDAMYKMTLEILGVAMNYPEDNRSDARSVENLKAKEPNEQQ